jgi:hypothetical protein
MVINGIPIKGERKILIIQDLTPDRMEVGQVFEYKESGNLWKIMDLSAHANVLFTSWAHKPQVLLCVESKAGDRLGEQISYSIKDTWDDWKFVRYEPPN